MRRVLLVDDDHAELLFLEKLLRKMGFDVATHKTEVGIVEQMLGFAPDIVVVQAAGKKLNGYNVCQKVRKNGSARILLLIGRGKLPDKEGIRRAHADALLETPVDPEKFLGMVARLGGMDEASLLLKFHKLDVSIGTPEKEESVHVGGGATHAGHATAVTGGGGGRPVATNERLARYRKLTEEEPLPAFKGFSRKVVEDQEREARQHAKENEELDKQIDAERRAFVRSLFRPK